MSSFVDEFDRPDAATLGSGWVESTNGFHIVSGAAVADTTATNVAQRALNLATGDHSAAIIIGNTYGGSFTGVAARMPTLGADGNSTGAYYLLILSGTTGTAFSIRRKEANSTTLTTLATGNSKVDGRLDGSAWQLDAYTDPDNSGQVLLRGYVNGVLVVSATDSTGTVPATQRRVGMYTGGTTGPDLRIGRVVGSDIIARPADTTPPTVPSSVTAAVVSASSVTVTWAASTDPNGVDSYRVRRDGADVALEVVGTSYTDTGLATGTHAYTVSAVDAAGNRSAESAVASVTIVPVDTTPPPVPSGVTATAGGNQVALSWTAVVAADLVGYRVYRWTAAAPTHVLIASPTAASFTDTGAAAGTAYSYAVRSVDQAGNVSAESATVTATPTTPSSTGLTFTRWTGDLPEISETLSGTWNGTAITAVATVEVFGDSSGGGSSYVDNGDGTFTVAAATAAGDGTYTLAATDNGDGTFTLAA